jgi:hypothetical protein
LRADGPPYSQGVALGCIIPAFQAARVNGALAAVVHGEQEEFEGAGAFDHGCEMTNDE